MTAHELAQALLAGPDHKIVLNVYGHVYDTERNASTHGRFMAVVAHGGAFVEYRKPCVVLCCAIDGREIQERGC